MNTEMIAGVDEAGVGPLMGNMVAGAVILPPDYDTKNLKDSKKMSEKKRTQQFEVITQDPSIMFGIGIVTAEEIDTLGLGKCRRLVFHRALDQLYEKYGILKIDQIIVDGNLFEDYHNPNNEMVNHICVPKADDIYPCVSAASILAKHTRDQQVYQLCEQEPQLAAMYKWLQNKGYPTKDHMSAIQEHGVTPYHRRSYGPCKNIV